MADTLVGSYIAKLRQERDEFNDACEELRALVDEINEIPNEDALRSQICRECSKDTFEQQQNYERIKEEVYKENDELKARVKHLLDENERLTANERDDWGHWRTKCLKQAEDIKTLQKDEAFWESSCHSTRAILDKAEATIKRQQERMELLEAKLKPYRESKMQQITNRIEAENMGRARR